MAKKAKKTQVTHRDAGTGRYVKKTYADRHPKTTIKETNKR
jgi:hypothetical protein